MKLLMLLTGTLLTACITLGGGDKPRLYGAIEPGERAKFVASGANGAVATAHPLASQAALQVLRDGGTAADAAVAASFVISVVRPQSTGIGGGGFLMWFDAKERDYRAYDFRERAPIKASRNMYVDKNGRPLDFQFGGKIIEDASVNGHLSVGTPGLIKGIYEFHRAHGTMPWARLVQPAIEIAEKGFPVYEGLDEALRERGPMLANFPSSKKIFFTKRGEVLKLGDLLVQSDLAKTLRSVATNGADGFYKGWVAEKILAEIKRGRGILGRRDFDQYQVKERTPISGTYKGFNIVSFPPPSSGGVHIVQMLNILEKLNLSPRSYNVATNVHLVAAAMKRAFADRAKYLGDPDFVKVPVAELISKTYADKLRATITEKSVVPSQKIANPALISAESPSTTHFSVVDRWGNAVSSTQTINYTFGSCVVAEGTGIVLNDEMDDFSKQPGVPNAYGLLGSEANAIAAKKTMLSSMSPSFVLDKDQNMLMVAGSPGGPRIINATFQTIFNVLEFKMPLLDAVHAVRIHHQWMPDKLFVEKGFFDASLRKELEGMGYLVTEVDGIGDVQAIMRTPDGWTAVSDARSDGKPLAY